MKNMDTYYFGSSQLIKKKKCADTAERDTLLMLKEELLDQILRQGSAEISDPVIFL